jgi:hypothetical protein
MAMFNDGHGLFIALFYFIGETKRVFQGQIQHAILETVASLIEYTFHPLCTITLLHPFVSKSNTQKEIDSLLDFYCDDPTMWYYANNKGQITERGIL